MLFLEPDPLPSLACSTSPDVMDMGTCLSLPLPYPLDNEVCLDKNIPKPLTTVSPSIMGRERVLK